MSQSKLEQKEIMAESIFKDDYGFWLSFCSCLIFCLLSQFMAGFSLCLVWPPMEEGCTAALGMLLVQSNTCEWLAASAFFIYKVSVC